jgi:hypothetical protein
MRIHFACPQCHKGLILSKKQAGTRLFCPVCSSALTVPTVDASFRVWSAETPGERPHVPVGQAYQPPGQAGRAPARQLPPSGINYRIVGATGAVALLLLVGLVATVLAVKPAAPTTLAAPDEIPAIFEARASGAGLSPERSTPTEEGRVSIDALDLPDEPAALVVGPAINDRLAVLSPAPNLVIPPPPHIRTFIKRRDRLADEQLEAMLRNVPEMKLDKDSSRNTSQLILYWAKNRGPEEHVTPHLLAKRDDLDGLPFRMGNDCQLGKEPTDNLKRFSTVVRQLVSEPARTANPEEFADTVRKRLRKADGQKITFAETAIPTLMQMLTPEDRPLRRVLVQHLGDLEHRSASEALAKLAIFDLSDLTRAEALQMLRDRPREEFRQVLLDGLRYPWAPVADHAAEALAVLKDKGAVPALKKLADLPDPKAPYWEPAQRRYVVRELVRVNHLSNCLMCHAPSLAGTDTLRARTPTPGQPLPPPIEYYSSQPSDSPFVRADVTYLRQDFSVAQPVARHGPWPEHQRFDFLVRTRPVTRPLNDWERQQLENQVRKGILRSNIFDKPAANYPQRDAVLFALKELGEAPQNGPPPKMPLGVATR